MSVYRAVLLLHIAMGSVALLTFWISAIARKGGTVHKRSGAVYLAAMAVVTVTGLPLATRILYEASFVFGLFLYYLLIIVATNVWISWRAIRDRRAPQRFTGPVYRVLTALNLVGGVAIAGLGIQTAQVLLLAFAPAAFFNGIPMLRNLRQAPSAPRWWLREHANAMLGNAVGTHIAFLAIGLPRLLPQFAGPTMNLVAWLAPLVVALLLRFTVIERYLRGPLPPRAALAASGSPAAAT